MGGFGLMVCEGFLVGGPCVCILVRGAESLFRSAVRWPVVIWGVYSLAWLWAVHL